MGVVADQVGFDLVVGYDVGFFLGDASGFVDVVGYFVEVLVGKGGHFLHPVTVC